MTRMDRIHEMEHGLEQNHPVNPVHPVAGLSRSGAGSPSTPRRGLNLSNGLRHLGSLPRIFWQKDVTENPASFVSSAAAFLRPRLQPHQPMPSHRLTAVLIALLATAFVSFAPAADTTVSATL